MLTHEVWDSARGCCWGRPSPVIQEAPHQVWRSCAQRGRSGAAAGWRQRVATNQLEHAASALLDRALGRLLCLADRLRVGLHQRRRGVMMDSYVNCALGMPTADVE